MARLSSVLLLLPLIAFIAGCGDGRERSTNPPRARVTGKITLDGAPVPAGVIEFIPLGRGQLQAQGIVRDDGTFVIDKTGGPSAGEYKVEIRCFRKTGRRVQSMSSSDGSGMIDEQAPVIPARYHSPTILLQAITNGDNVLEFALESK